MTTTQTVRIITTAAENFALSLIRSTDATIVVENETATRDRLMFDAVKDMPLDPFGEFNKAVRTSLDRQFSPDVHKAVGGYVGADGEGKGIAALIADLPDAVALSIDAELVRYGKAVRALKTSLAEGKAICVGAASGVAECVDYFAGIGSRHAALKAARLAKNGEPKSKADKAEPEVQAEPEVPSGDTVEKFVADMSRRAVALRNGGVDAATLKEAFASIFAATFAPVEA